MRNRMAVQLGMKFFTNFQVSGKSASGNPKLWECTLVFSFIAACGDPFLNKHFKNSKLTF